ncbi:MAG: phosphatidylglycerophosphatase A [Lentisphaeria bacterium]|nr:phosphatidylglycerophosphatase A [Candidatus Neomarinimicrobiota bacterium]MCF7841385.1 phosphatidylglycerophosphatase A [Lentisphaeria bacterium]
MNKSLAEFISTVGYVGRFPVAPGTAGSLVGLIFVILWHVVLEISLVWTLGVIFLLIWLGTVSADVYAKSIDVADPSQVVIDEFVGQWIALLLIPPHWGFWLAAFVLFRLFDIWKPWWIDRVQSWPGGWGVMADDILAGVFAFTLIQVYTVIL